jgi:8-oxo-dGTP diphosphatase
MRNIVNGLLVRREKVLMVRRAPHRRTYPGLWSFPGGHVEAGETLAEGLRRELEEELAVVATKFHLIAAIPDPNFPRDPATYHMYLVTEWSGGEPRLMDEEHTELRWFTKADALLLDDVALAEYRPLLARLPLPQEPGDERATGVARPSNES